MTDGYRPPPIGPEDIMDELEMRKEIPKAPLIPREEKKTDPPPVESLITRSEVIEIIETQLAPIRLFVHDTHAHVVGKIDIEGNVEVVGLDTRVKDLNEKMDKLISVMQNVAYQIEEFRSESTEQHSIVGAKVDVLDATVTLQGDSIIRIEKKLGMYPKRRGNGNGNGNGGPHAKGDS